MIMKNKKGQKLNTIYYDIDSILFFYSGLQRGPWTMLWGIWTGNTGP